jgi:hypothetical protein
LVEVLILTQFQNFFKLLWQVDLSKQERLCMRMRMVQRLLHLD